MEAAAPNAVEAQESPEQESPEVLLERMGETIAKFSEVMSKAAPEDQKIFASLAQNYQQLAGSLNSEPGMTPHEEPPMHGGQVPMEQGVAKVRPVL